MVGLYVMPCVWNGSVHERANPITRLSETGEYISDT